MGAEGHTVLVYPFYRLIAGESNSTLWRYRSVVELNAARCLDRSVIFDPEATACEVFGQRVEVGCVSKTLPSVVCTLVNFDLYLSIACLLKSFSMFNAGNSRGLIIQLGQHEEHRGTCRF